MKTPQNIDPSALATVTGALTKAAATPIWRPCETSPRYESWLREHPSMAAGK